MVLQPDVDACCEFLDVHGSEGADAEQAALGVWG